MTKRNVHSKKNKYEQAKTAAAGAIEQNILPWGQLLHPCVTANLKGPQLEERGDGEWEWSHDMWFLVDVMEIQGQDVVLAANIHPVMVFVHTQDTVVGRVEEVGEVMSGAGRSQLCWEMENASINDSCGAHANFYPQMHAQLTHSSCHSCIPVWSYLMVFHQHCCNLTPHIRGKCY